MPDLPQHFDEIAALWYDGNLIICGEKFHSEAKCYTFDKSDWQWNEDPEPFYYIRSGQVSFARPKNSWLLYVIGGLANNFGKSVLAYDYNTNAFTNDNAYHPSLYKHCTLELNISTILTIGKNHYFINQSDFTQPWKAKPHNLNLFSPSCLKMSDEKALVLDSESMDKLYQIDIESLEFTTFQLNEPLAYGSQLTMLDGKVYVIGGSHTVKEIVMSENTVNVMNAAKTLKQIRKNFAKVEMPLSYFT